VPSGPEASPLQLPPGYGKAKAVLAWDQVRDRLEQALHYGLATVRPDGRPNVVPLDGIWLDDRWYFGGSPETVKHRNLKLQPRATLHLEDAGSTVIVEGSCEELFADEQLARRLVELSKSKYGYAPPPSVYAREGSWRLEPERALAWERFPRDATRFTFRR
jgi:nitroimidazol reductase NimA-like FMN-containing flavoprotein (pyridoxamine 5'-phosphate oxidase superfamily)